MGIGALDVGRAVSEAAAVTIWKPAYSLHVDLHVPVHLHIVFRLDGRERAETMMMRDAQRDCTQPMHTFIAPQIIKSSRVLLIFSSWLLTKMGLARANNTPT